MRCISSLHHFLFPTRKILLFIFQMIRKLWVNEKCNVYVKIASSNIEIKVPFFYDLKLN